MGPLIDARELARRHGEVRVLDARASHDDYRASHVTGAVHADLEKDLSAPIDDPREGGRHPLPSPAAWGRTLGRWGIRPETPVVLYDDRGGAVAAARAWWMLRAAGHEQVAVVDGGWSAIREAGVPIDDGPADVEPADPYPFDRWHLPTVTLEEVDAHRGDPDRRVIDVRAAERYRGETEPLDPVAGHIPGAVNVPLAENLDARGHFEAPETLRGRYEAALAGVPPERAIVHCGSGVTACHTLLALEHAGLPGAALYVGSWSEWCRNRGA